jgi:hypothetical protein
MQTVDAARRFIEITKLKCRPEADQAVITKRAGGEVVISVSASVHLISKSSPLMRVSFTSSGRPAGLVVTRTIRSSATPAVSASFLASAMVGAGC